MHLPPQLALGSLTDAFSTEGFSSPNIWDVMFVGQMGRKLHWWEKGLDREYLHCLAMGWDGDRWVVVDARHSGTDVVSLPGVPGHYPLKDRELLSLTEIIAVRKVRNTRARRARQVLAPFTCVEVTKSLLGVNWPLVWTPRQLRNRLMKYNQRVEADHGTNTMEEQVEAGGEVRGPGGEQVEEATQNEGAQDHQDRRHDVVGRPPAVKTVAQGQKGGEEVNHGR